MFYTIPRAIPGECQLCSDLCQKCSELSKNMPLLHKTSHDYIGSHIAEQMSSFKIKPSQVNDIFQWFWNNSE